MEILEEKKLSNEVIVTVQDESKKLAADRWLIKLRCVSTIAWSDWMDEIIEAKADINSEIRKDLEPIRYEIVRERNFVDERDKSKIVADMQSALLENIEKYMESATFAQNCFKKKLEEWREKEKLAPVTNYAKMDEDDGPADFSACFR